MKLNTLTFNENRASDSEWYLDGLTFSQVNLLVGKNATGKTRTLNVINFLSTLFTGAQREIIATGSYEVVFEHEGDKWEYFLEYDSFVVTRERLLHNGTQVLHRGQGGLGRILAEDIEGKRVEIKFSVPGPQVAVFAKRDDVQHSFLKPLHDWAASVRFFKFGTEMSPYSLALKVKDVKIEVDERQTNALVPIFHKASMELGPKYVEAIIEDMGALGYDLEAIEIRQPDALVTNVILPGELVGVSVREKSLRCLVHQPSISQGMYRALSLIAQVNYYALSKKPACILVDDIGDGLDFERSCEIIGVLRRKAAMPDLQIVMSSNNRFVMNNVPLDEWCLLQRKGHHVRARTYRNSKNAFDRFKITGLSNFDLLATDYLEKVHSDG